MKKVEFFYILLQKHEPVYSGGETVIGTLHMRIRERLRINGVRLEARGEGHVYWSEPDGKNLVANFSRTERYLQVRETFEEAERGRDLYLEPGDYAHPFQIALPVDLPSSYACQYGEVLYGLTGTVDVPREFNMSTRQAFSIRSRVDLNLNMALRTPVCVRESRVVMGGLCCRSGAVAAMLRVNKSGFVAGEMIVADVSVENGSPRDVRPPELLLVESVRLSATARSKVVRRELRALCLGRKVRAGETDSFERVGFQVPVSVCPSSALNTSHVIQITYQLVLRLAVAGSSERTELAVPVTIGSVRMRDE